MALDLTTVFLSFAGGIIWLIRLEGRVNQQEKLFDVYTAQQESVQESLNKINDSITEIKVSIAKLEHLNRATLAEAAAQLKQLLRDP